MAKGRRVVGDQNSEELDQLRRTVHTMLLMLQNLGAMLQTLDNTSAATIVTGMTQIGAGLEAAIANGQDDDIGATLYVGATGLPVEGVIPTPKHPRRANVGKAVDLDPKDL